MWFTWTSNTRLLLLAPLAILVCVAGCGGNSPESATPNTVATTATNPEIEIPFRKTDGAVTLKIGSTRSAESQILAQIYAQALAAAGYNVKTDPTFTSEAAERQALKTGAITGYPDHSERVLALFFGYRPHDIPGGAIQEAELANREFVKEGLTNYEPTPYASAAGHVIWVTTPEAVPTAGPDYAKWIKHVGWRLTTPVMRRLRAVVGRGQMTPRKAAAAYLKSAGYVE